jgi:hypothetical protein
LVRAVPVRLRRLPVSGSRPALDDDLPGVAPLADEALCHAPRLER